MILVPLAACAIAVVLLSTPSRAVDHVLKTDPDAAAFERLYPGSWHFISHYTGTHGPPKWNSVTVLYGRYQLTMQFPLRVDRIGATASATSPPSFELLEFDSISRDGRRTSFTDSGSVQFGPTEWKAVQAAGVDIGALGIRVLRNQPEPNVGATWRHPVQWPASTRATSPSP